jgi:23S rRNA (adenine2030-N6)-methyltransferase
MASELQHIAPGDWLHVSLKVAPPPEDGLGLYGSGMFVFNPPWNLEAGLRECMPVLARLLDQQGYGSFTLNFKQT